MDVFSAGLLGIVQGLTEFLPVSSSAHLIFAQALIPGFSQPGILFDVFLHGGTLLAVLIYFRKTILELATFKNPRLLGLLLLGTIPAGLAGILFNDFFEASFSSVFWAAATLLVTGVMNLAVDSVHKGTVNS
ncbi:MAG: undecaprenyl-diphosphate phosphatase, partial [bacterium]|nr:undecaprenyl-diphosphate phosphatase [bacterium]